MRKLLLYTKIILLVGCCCSCMSNNDKCLQKLFKDTGIETFQIQAATHLVIIPGNGCGKCIDKAKDGIHVSQDTLYILTCRSEKEFYLLTGRHLNEFPNVYLDTKEVAASMKMVGTIPMVYVMEKGGFISRAPYAQEDSTDDVIRTRTEITVNQEEVNWGRFDHKERKEASFILENTGSDSLHIVGIVPSCDCLQIECSRFHIPPGDTLQVQVFFQSDSIGEFIRDIYVYGNFPQLSLRLTVEGDCI
ncbi:DUF1573 domain-containing protein [Phocaeicola sp.]